MRGCAVFDLGCRDGAWNVRVASLLLWRRYVDEKKKKIGRRWMRCSFGVEVGEGLLILLNRWLIGIMGLLKSL